MLRTKVIQGVLSADQAEAMASIARDFGRGIIDCTTRQCFQIHWITLDQVPEIFERLDRVGLTTSGACGDITRNVIGCTLAGLGHEEIVDGYATARRSTSTSSTTSSTRTCRASTRSASPAARGLRPRPDQRHRALGRDRADGTAASTCASAAALRAIPLRALDGRLRRRPRRPRGDRRHDVDLPRLRGEPEGRGKRG
jgi:hypothetical protein